MTSPFFKVLEHPDLYDSKILSYIRRSIKFKHSSVSKDIMKLTNNKQYLYYEDKSQSNGFKLMKDVKWKDNNLNNLHWLAVVNRKNLYTLRELKQSDIKLLNNITVKSLLVLKNNFNINADKLYIYVHYLPSIFRFHVHFVNINAKHLYFNEVSICTAFPLELIIQNLNIDSDYYKKISIPTLANDKYFKILNST
jgi:m7GpppX diphosphatase